mgnify:CR=1 FL=1
MFYKGIKVLSLFFIDEVAKYRNYEREDEKGDYLLQNFALFTDQKALSIPEKQTMRLMDVFWKEIEKNKDYIAPVLCYEDIEKNEKASKISALLTLEDGGVVFNESFYA